MIYGLNTFAGQIMGAGKFSFAHGTSGGGQLITVTAPTETEMGAYSLQVQNALLYAKLKEKILSEPNVFRCDILDSHFQVIQRTCGFEEYRALVSTWARQVREAGLRLGREAEIAKPLIAGALKDSLQGVRNEVR